MFPPKILLWFPACKWMGLEIDSFLGNSDMGLPLWSWKHLEDHTVCEEGSLWGAQKQTSLGELRTSPAALPALSPWWRVPSMEHPLEALLPPHAPPPPSGWPPPPAGFTSFSSRPFSLLPLHPHCHRLLQASIGSLSLWSTTGISSNFESSRAKARSLSLLHTLY